MSSRSRQGLLSLGLLSVISACGADQAPPQPDVVLIVMDTTRQDRVGPFSKEDIPGPFFEKLAAQSVLFENAWTASSWTAPSSATIHTGLYPQRHGLLQCLWAQVGKPPEGTEVRDVLAKVDLVAMPSDVQTLGEHLALAGYRGIGVAANPNICEELGFARGFESFTLKNDVGTEELIQHFHAAKSEEETERPLFAYFHLNDPHAPYQRHEEHCPHQGDGSECPPSCNYQSEIDFVGAQLSDLFEEMGWWKDAIIVLVNDHGEEFGEHGQFGHRFSLHPEVCRAPLMITAPGLAPLRTSLPAHQVDILPTVLHLAGLPQPVPRDGMNLADIADLSQHKERPILSHRSEPQNGKELWSLLVGDWRLTEEQPAGTVTLFNLSEDPSEKTDLADAHPERAASMSERLNAIRSSLSPLRRNKVQVDLTYRLNMELRRLGYVGEEEDE